MSERSAKISLRASSVTVIISLSLVLFMLGLAGWAMLNFQNLTNSLKEEFGFQVVIQENAGDAKIHLLQKELESSGYIKSVEFKSKELAAEEMKKELGEDFISFLGENPLEPTINLKLKSEFVTNDSLKWIVKEVQAMAGGKVVKEVNYHQLLFDEMDRNSRDIGLVLLILAILLTVVAVGLINNTIRLSIYSKRFLLRTMYLVGATRGFIRKPFILKGIRQGIIAGIFACVLMAGFIFLVIKLFPVMIENQDPNQLLFLMGGIILTGVLISAVSAAFAVSKYLSLKTSDMYL